MTTIELSTAEHTGNAASLEAVRAVVAGGGSSNMRNAAMTRPIVVERAAGCRIWDVEGAELVDMNMGYGPHLYGYADPDVLGAVADRLRLGVVTGIPHRLDAVAGELIADLVPSVDQVRFANSGTEAIASALRLARFATGRTLVVSFEGHYHGWSETILRKATITSGQVGLGAGVLPGAPGMIPEALGHTVQLPWNDPAAVDDAFARFGDRVAAVILEPVCGNAGVVHPAPGFLAHVAERTRRHGALLVFDEVITGFRLGPGGAQERYGIHPDLTILSKVLGGGFPVAAFGGPAAVMAPLARNEAFHAGVYAGNHAAVAAVVATLTKIGADRAVYERLDREAGYLQQRLAETFMAAGRPVRLVRAGSILSAALLAAPPPDADPDHAAWVSSVDFPAHRRLQRECQAAGVYFHPNPLEPWFLSAAHRRADLDRVVAVLEHALRRS